MVPLALTSVERRLLAAAAIPACLAGTVALGYALAWCLAAAEDELLGTVLLSIVGFAPTWIVAAAGLRLGSRLRGGWVDTRSLPWPTGVLVLGAPLVVLTTRYEALATTDPWRWASVLPAVSAVLALALLGSTFRRRWGRLHGSRWSPTPQR